MSAGSRKSFCKPHSTGMSRKMLINGKPSDNDVASDGEGEVV